MIVKVVTLLVLVSLGCQASRLELHHLGCYQDKKGDNQQYEGRALPVYLGHKSIDDCAEAANRRGFKVFGIQNGNECWSGKNGDKTYNKHGFASNCKNGKGGSWANDVYYIKGFKAPECPEKEFLGLRPKNAVKNCKTLKAKNPDAKTGIYWINPTGGKGKAFQAYCDMDTAGGGWTLVYSYTFTNYAHFGSGSNAITPQPDWPGVGNIPRSTTPPLSETHYAAMHFNLWKQIGSEFMIKSNINHWVQCTEGVGSLLNWKSGSIACKVVKNVGHTCLNIAPNNIKFITTGSGGNDFGPDLEYLGSRGWIKAYYYLEAHTRSGNWPTHDPCGTNGYNQVKGVVNPHGNIYIR